MLRAGMLHLVRVTCYLVGGGGDGGGGVLLLVSYQNQTRPDQFIPDQNQTRPVHTFIPVHISSYQTRLDQTN